MSDPTLSIRNDYAVSGRVKSDPLRRQDYFDGWLRGVKARAWAEGFDAGERDVFKHDTDGWDTECIPNPYGAVCHCGSLVASIAQPGAYANPNMVDAFCGECITVRCDAVPGACDPARQSERPTE
jgi:hypothetical protein